MSLNHREIALILSELPLAGSVIQHVIQHDFHCLTWEMYSPGVGRWELYTEIGTAQSRIHRVSRMVAAVQGQKTAKLQRFVQFARKHLEGARITNVHQAAFDRMVDLSLDNHGTQMHLIIRLYSGPQANIIVTDGAYTILDLLYRRPKRGETSAKKLELPPERTEEGKVFTVRPRLGDVSFNEQIEAEYGQASNKDSLAGLMAKVCQKRDRELMMLEGTARSLTRKAQANAGYMEMKLEGDLLSSYKYLLKPHMDHIEVDDYTTGGKRVIALDPKLTPSENIEACYARYQKAKGTWQDSVQEHEKIKAQKARLETHYRELLLPCDDERVMIRRLQKELREETADKKPESASPGLTFHSGRFTILVGRNAKENDALLRHWVKSYDWWMHTRDWPGGYVFIKAFKDKSVPLEVMLDAANLAVTYSKGKNQGAADLYYTQVKYLRRAKDGPLGLVLPTQEKNFFVKVDQDRLARVMQTKEGSDD